MTFIPAKSVVLFVITLDVKMEVSMAANHWYFLVVTCWTNRWFWRFIGSRVCGSLKGLEFRSCRTGCFSPFSFRDFPNNRGLKCSLSHETNESTTFATSWSKQDNGSLFEAKSIRFSNILPKVALRPWRFLVRLATITPLKCLSGNTTSISARFSFKPASSSPKPQQK